MQQPAVVQFPEEKVCKGGMVSFVERFFQGELISKVVSLVLGRAWCE